MSEECHHRFKVEKVCEGLPLCQILFCNACGNRYLGFEGEIGKPKAIHKVHKTMTTQMFETVLAGGNSNGNPKNSNSN